MVKTAEPHSHSSNASGCRHKTTTAAWLVQLVERQSAVREVDGSYPRPDQHSGS